MQYAVPFIATAAVVFSVAIVFAFAIAAALFVGALTVARAEQSPRREPAGS